MSCDGLSFDGEPLRGFGRVEESWSGVLAPGPLRYDPDEVPRRDGALDHIPVLPARRLSVAMTLVGSTRAEYMQMVRNLNRLCFKPDLKLLERSITYADDGLETHEAMARLVRGIDPEARHKVGRVVLDFIIPAGKWFATAPTTDTISGAATFAMPGDWLTTTITLVFAGAGSLTNATTGSVLTVGSAMTIDVDAKTTTGDPNDVSHTGTLPWFVLAPGNNSLTSTVSVDISATAVYL